MIIQGVTISGLEVYDASFNSRGALLYLNAGNSSSYSGSGTTWSDLSTNDNDATLVGSPTFTSAGSASYFSFNGTGSQYASTVSSKYNQLYSGKTVMAAVRISPSAWTNGVSWHRGIFGTATGARNFSTYIYHDSANNLKIHYSANGVGGYSDIVSIPANTWAVIAVTQTTLGVVSYYLNGQAVGTSTGQTFSQWVSSSTENIGRLDNYWYGDIGVIAVYGRTLTPDEIRQNYNAIRSMYTI